MLTVNKAIVETEVLKNVWLRSPTVASTAETQREICMFEGII